MKTIYSDKSKALKSIWNMLLLTLGGLAVLGIINYVSITWFGYYFIPHILVLPALYLLFSIVRSLLQIFLPAIKLDENRIAYFNILAYSKCLWEHINDCTIQENQLLIINNDGKVKLQIDLNEITEMDRSELLHHLQQKGFKPQFIETNP